MSASVASGLVKRPVMVIQHQHPFTLDSPYRNMQRLPQERLRGSGGMQPRCSSTRSTQHMMATSHTSVRSHICTSCSAKNLILSGSHSFIWVAPRLKVSSTSALVKHTPCSGTTSISARHRAAPTAALRSGTGESDWKRQESGPDNPDGSDTGDACNEPRAISPPDTSSTAAAISSSHARGPAGGSSTPDGAAEGRPPVQPDGPADGREMQLGQQPGQQVVMKKRRGRPPRPLADPAGAKNVQQPRALVSDAPRRRGRPPLQDSGAAEDKEQLGQQPGQQVVMKKRRGRPPRPLADPAEAKNVQQPRALVADAPRRRGRPPLQDSGAAENVEVQRARQLGDLMAAARLEELQRAIQLELGAQYRLPEKVLTPGLARALGRYSLDLRGRVAELKEVVGVAVAGALLHNKPYLLLQIAPAEVAGRLDEWAEAFRASREAVKQLCVGRVGAASLLAVASREDKGRRVEALCSVMGVERGELLRKCCSSHRVLGLHSDTITQRAAGLGTELGLSPEELASLLRRMPNCLVSSGVKAQVARIKRVQREVGSSWEEAVGLCVAQPALLNQPERKVEEVAGWLRERLSVGAERLVECTLAIVSSPVATLEARLDALPSALGLTPKDALGLAMEEPNILRLSTESLQQGWADLRWAAGSRPEWRLQVGAWRLSTWLVTLHSPSRIRPRVQQLLDLDPPSEQLPSLRTVLASTEARLAVLLRRVEAGEYRSNPSASVGGEGRLVSGSLRERHPGLWQQM